jgi:hypothetical protein
LVMGEKTAVVVTSLHEKLFDPQTIQTSWVVEFRSLNANLLAQIKTKIISHVYYYIWKLSFPDQSSIAKWLIKEKKDIFETLSVPLLDDIKLKSQIINQIAQLIVRYLIIIILNFIAVSFYTNKSFMPNT